jgi:hypothetical protein
MRPSSHLGRKDRGGSSGGSAALKAALYDEMGAFKRAYYDAFQVAVMSRCTIATASGFIKSARAMDLLMARYDTEDGLRFRDLFADPSCHRKLYDGMHGLMKTDVSHRAHQSAPGQAGLAA